MNARRANHRRPDIESIERRLLLSAGQLDSLFGDSGMSRISLPGGPAELHDLQVLHDGRILGVGTHATAGATKLILVRLLPDGRPDSSFGDGRSPLGVVDPEIPGAAGRLQLLDKGRFLFASGSRLIRFNADGSVDSSFIQDEPSRFKFSFSTLDIDVQPDGMILLCGRYKQAATKPGHFAAARLKPDGTRDRGFGIGGVADFFQHTNSPATAVRAMPDGSIFVAGGINHGYPTDLDEYTRQDLICMKLQPDGTHDPSYGTGGVGKMTGRFFAGATMVAAIGADGSATITAAGDDLRVYRLDPQGMPDSSFGTNGVAAPPSFNGYMYRPLVGHDGSLLIAYRSFTIPDPSPLVDRVMRITHTGQLDTTFGTAGIATWPASTSPLALNAITFGNDGSILVGGTRGEQIFVSRLWRDDAPAVQLNAPNHKTGGSASYRFSVSVRDDVAVDVASIDSSDFRVIAPDGRSFRPTLMSLDTRRGPALIGVNLKLAAPGGAWSPQHNGQWQVRLLSNHIFDTAEHASPGRVLGSFWVRVA